MRDGAAVWQLRGKVQGATMSTLVSFSKRSRVCAGLCASIVLGCVGGPESLDRSEAQATVRTAPPSAHRGGPSVWRPTDPGGRAGTYDVTYGHTITATLRLFGAAYTATATPDGMLHFRNTPAGTLSLALGTLCARADVTCPQEVFPAQATLTETPVGWLFPGVYNARVTSLAAPTCGQSLGALTNDRDEFLIARFDAAGANPCGVLALGRVSGRFSRDEARRVTALRGTIAVGVLGACTQSSVLLGATLELSLPFEALRRGPEVPATPCGS
jgi:hypothetical protein